MGAVNVSDAEEGTGGGEDFMRRRAVGLEIVNGK
jgi:hypothetical protein